MKTAAIKTKALRSCSNKLGHVKAAKLQKITWSFIRGVLIAGICFVTVYPLLIKLHMSIMTEGDLYDSTVRFIPRNFTMENFKVAWELMVYPTASFNSLKVSLMVSILQVASCTIIGYGFARFNFAGKNLLFAMCIITLVVPPQTIMLPMYLHFRFFDLTSLFSIGSPSGGVNLLDSYWPFTFLSATGLGLKNGLYIYIIRQFFRGMPKELEEAAYVDGAGLFKTFYKIMLPSAMPAMATIFLFSFVWQWNDSFYTSLFLSDLPVLPNRLASLASNLRYRFGHTDMINMVYESQMNSVGSILLIIPLLVVYLIAQRYFVESIERTGIVG